MGGNICAMIYFPKRSAADGLLSNSRHARWVICPPFSALSCPALPQESRQKRDEFLKQMNSFLKGIEDNNTDVVPPDPATSLVDAAGGSSAQPSNASRLYPALPDLSLVSHQVPRSPSVRIVDGQHPPTSSLMQEAPGDTNHAIV